MSGTLGKIKGKNPAIKNKELRWFKIILEKLLKGELGFNNVRASFKGKGEWVKVTFWCNALKLDKEELKDGSSKAKEGTGSKL